MWGLLGGERGGGNRKSEMRGGGWARRKMGRAG